MQCTSTFNIFFYISLFCLFVDENIILKNRKENSFISLNRIPTTVILSSPPEQC